MNLNLKDKRVLITGGSKGIGLAIAKSFAHEGAIPILVSRTSQSLAIAKAEILNETSIQAQCIEHDVAQSGSIGSLIQRAGEFDILVNNAGAIPGGSVLDIDEARWRESWELKLFGYINLIRAVLPIMQSRKSGVIANIIGMAGAAPRNAYICGSTANAALIAFTQALGASTPKHGVRVFGINPSPTRSDRMMGMLKSQAQKKLGDENRWMELTQHMPFGRMAEPDELAHLTTFCCSPLAGYLSGSVINVDGGQMFTG
jgi:NAD(P)-dependent dehydrogenase (short-subunit alcohol dehydrogenase family)